MDHNSYSASPANRLIEQLTSRSLAQVIAVTSKTGAELDRLQRSIPLPATIGVTENGSAVQIPAGFSFAGETGPSTLITGISYDDIRAEIERLPQELRKHFTGFADMSDEQVARSTGLDIEDARLARKRQATEPFLWTGSDRQLADLRKIFDASNIWIQRGGRFFHCTGPATKDKAVLAIRDAFAAERTEDKIVTIALGDGPNDLTMIEAADFGVIVPNPHGMAIASSARHVRTAPAPGPGGWRLAVTEILSELGFNLRES